MDEQEIKEATPEEIIEEVKPTTDEQPEPPAELTDKQISEMLKQTKVMVETLESFWKESQKEYGITDSHMKLLYQFNESHRDPRPNEDMAEQEYDAFNGLDKLTEENGIEIFGEGHKIMADQTWSTALDRIKMTTQNFFSWLAALKEYRQIHDAYIELMEFKEEEGIKYLREALEKETDEQKKIKLMKNLDEYIGRKHLDFLAEPLPEEKVQRLVSAFADKKKIRYWMDKSIDKLNSLGISPKFIQEISQLEKRFLNEKYHVMNNIFLVYFINLLAFADIMRDKDKDKQKIICIVFTMDRFIRNVWKPEVRERILNNIITFENQFLEHIVKKPESEN